MATTTITVTVKVCDRCKKSSADEKDPFKWAYSTFDADVAGAGMDGGWGGYRISGDLCGDCTEKFKKFIKGGELA